MNKPAKEILLRVKNLKVELDRQLILSGVSFELARQETLAIIGPNGAGKTTLFRALLGLVPYQGEISWQKSVRIGYVPQKLFIDQDLPLTTAEFLALKGSGLNPARLKKALDVVGLGEEDILKKSLGVLSSGERQRILIAWALLGHPDVLLFDEPTAGIDISAEMTIYNLLHTLQEKERLTILMISHELQIVYKYATKVICLNKEKFCYGPPRDVFSQTTLKEFFGGEVGFYRHH